MAVGPPLVPLDELESAFSLQEHLAALHYHHTGEGTRALTREAAHLLSQPPPDTDRTLWLYELCRLLVTQCNSLIVGFLFDSPPCSAATCPEMRASEWQFLCAVHEQPKSCCAIDYCCHTLDWAANVVTDQNLFPSRFVILSDSQRRSVVVKNLINVFRRVHRIFAHAWFQHRSVFWLVEGRSGLYMFFKMVCDLYDLLPSETYKLPPEAEGLELTEAEAETPTGIVKPPSLPTILKSNSSSQSGSDGGGSSVGEDGQQAHGRTTARRHVRSSPSTGSAVTTVMETDEEEVDAMTRGFKNPHSAMSSSNLSQFADEPESAEVPVTAGQSSSRSSLAAALLSKLHKKIDVDQESRHAAMARRGKEAAVASRSTDCESEKQPAADEENARIAESADEEDSCSVVLATQDSSPASTVVAVGGEASPKESSPLDSSDSKHGVDDMGKDKTESKQGIEDDSETDISSDGDLKTTSAEGVVASAAEAEAEAEAGAGASETEQAAGVQ